MSTVGVCDLLKHRRGQQPRQNEMCSSNAVAIWLAIWNFTSEIKVFLASWSWGGRQKSVADGGCNTFDLATFNEPD